MCATSKSSSGQGSIGATTASAVPAPGEVEVGELSMTMCALDHSQCAYHAVCNDLWSQQLVVRPLINWRQSRSVSHSFLNPPRSSTLRPTNPSLYYHSRHR